MRFFFALLFFSTTFLQAIPLDQITDLDGKTATLSHTKDKEFVLFWATWCVTCKTKLTKTLPLELIPKYPNTYFLTVNIDSDIGRVKSYIQKNEIKLPVFRDPSRKTLLDPLKVNTAPHWAVYQKEKEGTWKLLGANEGFELDQIIPLIQ